MKAIFLPVTNQGHNYFYITICILIMMYFYVYYILFIILELYFIHHPPAEKILHSISLRQ